MSNCLHKIDTQTGKQIDKTRRQGTGFKSIRAQKSTASLIMGIARGKPRPQLTQTEEVSSQISDVVIDCNGAQKSQRYTV